MRKPRTNTTLPRAGRSPNGRRLLPTVRHRPALWECMLGTVFACSPTGVVKYFDYDYDAALQHAGITPETADVRIGRYGTEGHVPVGFHMRGESHAMPRHRQSIWWIPLR